MYANYPKITDGINFMCKCGAEVEFMKLTGISEPANFDAIWTRQMVPIKPEIIECPGTNPRFEAFAITIDSPGGKPVKGYLSYPKGAAPKFPAPQVSPMGYGILSATSSNRRAGSHTP
jgi:cephalosporin-C deacetylase-like acetyl esterase